VIAALGEPPARELLDVLERSDPDRAVLMGGCTSGTMPRGWPSSWWTSRTTPGRSPGCGDVASARFILSGW